MLDAFFHWFGYGLCHQLPERSYVAGGVQVPVCARDTGIYLGFVVGFTILVWAYRRSLPWEFPRLHGWLAMGALTAFMAWDGVTSYAGLRTTTNDLRLSSGLGVGFAVAALVTPMLADALGRRRNSARVLDPPAVYFAWLAAIPATFALLRYGGHLLGAGYAVVVALATVVTLSVVNLVIVGMIWPARAGDPPSPRLRVMGMAALLLSGVEIGGAALLRLGLEAVARSLA